LTFGGRINSSQDAYSKRRNLADIKNKLREIKHMDKESREHLADISILSEEIEYDKKKAEMERHLDSHTAQSAVRQKQYTAELVRRRHNNHHHSPPHHAQQHVHQTVPPHDNKTAMSGAFSGSTRHQSPEAQLYAPFTSISTTSLHNNNNNTLLTSEVAKALQAAAEARAALEREVVERAMAENAANEKLDREARVSASLREEVSKLQSANMEADRERRLQRDEIRELRQSMNDLRASLSDL
jgi:hypothetical protein